MCSLAALARGCRPAAANKPCCLCWCCCCSCSWARCLAERNSDGGPGKKPGEFGPQEPLLNDADATPTLDEIQSWGQSFDRLMRSAAGRTVFRDFLRGEYSEENIMFWLACEELKRETDPDAVEEKARFIYEDYISILSPKEVSLDSRVREVVNRNMVEPTPHTFDDAQLQIYTLMHRDSYPRFVNSQVYKKMAHLLSTEPPSATPATPAALESSGTPASPASPALVALVAPVAPDEATTTLAFSAPPVPAVPLVLPVPAAPVTPPVPAEPVAPQLPATPVAPPMPAAPAAPTVPAAPVAPPVSAAPIVPPVPPAPAILAAPLAPLVPAAPLAPPGQVQPAQ